MKCHISIIIPVFCEQTVINQTIVAIRSRIGGDAAEIIVVDGQAEGGTLAAIKDGSVQQLPSEKGRGRQLNRGAIAATGYGLGEKMANVFQPCVAKGFAATLLIGSDSPDLTAGVIEEAFQALENGQDAVVGPAFDGGYYLIGFRAAAFAPAVFNELPWGENGVLEETLTRLRDNEYIVHLTPAWHDIDTEQDLRNLWSRHRDSPFGRSRTMAFLRKRWGG